MENRYEISEIFYENEDLIVFRMFDHLLGQSVYGIKMTERNPDKLSEIALRLEAANKFESKLIVILSIKEVYKEPVLVFSIKKKDMRPTAFAHLLEDDILSVPKVIGTIEGSSEGKYKNKILQEGTFLDDRYRIVGCIGIGGFGIIYLCEDILLHRNVAIKEYYPNEWAVREGNYVTIKKSNMLSAFRYGKKSFLNEVQMSARFIHTVHMASVYDAFEENDTAYMVMEYLSGISIGREMKRRNYKPYTVEEMSQIIFPLLEALEEVHNLSIVHGDISPGNIIRAENGMIYLIDMGAAKYISDSETPLSAAFLKVNYAAPEQYRTAKQGSPKDEGPWTDIYSVGITMYYMLTGHRPPDVIKRLGSSKTGIPSPKEYGTKITRELEKVLEQAVELDKDKRIQDAKTLKSRIKSAMRFRYKAFI